jgi:hypothetical protein
MPAERLHITATEIADYVFCQRSWSLRRAGTRLSDETVERLAAGEEFQARTDERVLPAMEGRAQATRAALLAKRTESKGVKAGAERSAFQP